MRNRDHAKCDVSIGMKYICGGNTDAGSKNGEYPPKPYSKKQATSCAKVNQISGIEGMPGVWP